jgi:alpha-1,3-rhamnosyltransferase
MKAYQPFVSIIVITYNSSKYVLETLESIKAQTYQNIELIVTDDCSIDDTINICASWMERNRDRFIRTELLAAPANTGIAANCNRGVAVARGEWVKTIAGDDILLPDGVSAFITFIQNNPKAKIVSAGVQSFGQLFEIKDNYLNTEFQKLAARQQLHYLLRRGCTIQGSSVFFEKNILSNLHGFDEKYPFFEDHPFFVKATLNNLKIYGLKKICVRYRRHEESIINDTSSSNSKFLQSYNAYMRNVAFPLLLREKLYFLYWHKKIDYFLIDRENKYPYNMLIFRYLLVSICDPYRYYKKIKQFVNNICA